MRRLIFDIETDGLLPELTRIHSLCIRDAETGKLVFSGTDASSEYPPVSEGLRLLSEAETVYAHNGINFDEPAIRKLHPDWKLRAPVWDTMVIARMRFAHIKDSDFDKVRRGKLPGHLAGRHSLEAWGHRLGRPKFDYTAWCHENGIADPWAQWTPKMQEYCEGDTSTTFAIVELLRSSKLSRESVETEIELAYYLDQQERNGWPFDLKAAYELHAELSSQREEIAQRLREHFGSWYVPQGQFIPKRDNKKMGYAAGVPMTKIKLVEFNPSSRDHIAFCLQKRYGWKPTKFTNTGKPEVNEGTLKGLDIPIAPDLNRFLLLEKRLGQLAEGKQAWLKQVTPDGKIHHRVNQSGTVTHRGSHSHPNLGQVPAVKSPFGPECRALFTVPKGWVMVGADASGLELRCLAHYMAKFDDGEYGKAILEGKNEDGTDIHSRNRDALGLEGKAGREKAKTFIYAYLYGAGDEKLGSIMEPGWSPKKKKALGKTLRARFERGVAALGMLSAGVKGKAKKPGYLKLPDGRRVYIRSAHAALNSLLQGAGAVICKRWIVHFNRRLVQEFGPQGWDGKWAALGWIHDEVQIACRPEIADRLGEILVEEIQKITEHFSFRIPLTGEYKVGRSWYETH